METIDRTTAKEQVKKALRNVADFNGEFELFNFTNFHNFHKIIFLRTLKTCINQLPCSNDLGQLLSNEYFDLDLTESLLDEWETISQCIDYVVTNQYRVVGNRKKIKL